MKKSTVRQLSEYLDQEGSNMFDEKGIELQIAALSEIEQRGILAMVTAGKQNFQKEVAKSVITDVFKQGLELMRMCNRQLAILKLLKVAELGEDASNLLQALVCNTQLDVLSMDSDLTKLMQSVLHIMKKTKTATV